MKQLIVGWVVEVTDIIFYMKNIQKARSDVTKAFVSFMVFTTIHTVWGLDPAPAEMRVWDIGKVPKSNRGRFEVLKPAPQVPNQK